MPGKGKRPGRESMKDLWVVLLSFGRDIDFTGVLKNPNKLRYCRPYLVLLVRLR